MNSNYYVIAGNRAQFDNFIRRKADELWRAGNKSISLSDFVYVSDESKVRGLSNPKGFFIGTWKLRPDIKEIMINLAGSVSNDINKSTIIKDLWKELHI